jgi:hypothetical protein
MLEFKVYIHINFLSSIMWGRYHFVFRLLNIESTHFFSGEKLPMGDTRVESPITEHIPIIKHFSTFSSFLNQIKRCWCHWMCKSKGYKCFWVLKVKDQLKKYKCSLGIESKGPTQETQEEDGWKFASIFLER